MTTSLSHRRRGGLLAAVVAVLLIATAGPAAALPAGDGAGFGAEDNQAVAINEQDGASLFRFAFSVRYVTDGIVDQTNTAAALASCVDCQTVAVAFQVILVAGDADVVVPENVAVAVNSQCAECFTYATATQLVVGVDGPVTLTRDGWRRLATMHRTMRELERTVGDLTPDQLLQSVQAAKAELIAIVTEELVPLERRAQDDEEEDDDAESDGSTTTTTVPSASTSTSTPTTTDTTTTTIDTSTSTSTSTTTVETTTTTTAGAGG